MARNVLHVPWKNAGFWGESTATLDWCEENYHFTPYIAEFWNSLSNFGFIVAGFYGAWQILSAPAKIHIPRRYAALYAWMGVIGIGSFLFHATLKYSMQLLDEVPMLFSNSQMLYILWHPELKLKVIEGIIPKWFRQTPIGYYAFSILLTTLYVTVPSCTLFFQVSYGMMLVLVSISLHFYAGQLLSEHGATAFNGVKVLLQRSAVFVLSAFALWNVDNLFCHHLRLLRSHHLPAFMGPMFQLHAWWHILTMISGTHSMVALLVVWCKVHANGQLRWRLKSHFGGILPWVHFQKASQKKGKTN